MPWVLPPTLSNTTCAMQIFLRRYAVVGCVLIFVISCQTKVVASIPTGAYPEMPSLSVVFSKIESRLLGIRNLKAIVSTKISGSRLNQTFRHALLVRGNKAIRLETYNLFRQVLSVLIYDAGKALMYDPKEDRVVRGEEVWDIMRRIMGNHFDLRKYISVFFGKIPRFSHLQAKVSKWNADQTVYQVEAVDRETGEQVNIEIDAYTQLPKSVLLIRGTQEIYRVYWDDYRKVDQWDFAHKVIIELKAKNEVVTVKYSDLFINQKFAPDSFEFLPK